MKLKAPGLKNLKFKTRNTLNSKQNTHTHTKLNTQTKTDESSVNFNKEMSKKIPKSINFGFY